MLHNQALQIVTTQVVTHIFQKNKKLDFFSVVEKIIFYYFWKIDMMGHIFNFEKAKSWSSSEGLWWRMFGQMFFFNFAEKSKAILFCEISGFSFRLFKIPIFVDGESHSLFFIGIIFSVYQNLLNYESSFFSVRK